MKRLIAAIAAVFVLAVALIVATSDEEKPKPAVVTVAVDGADVDKRADDAITVPKAAIEQASESDVAHHDGLKTELPPNVTTEQLEQAQEQQQRLAEADNLPVLSPLAAPEQQGCRSTFVQNASSRRGVRPRLWVLHYTVSANRPGWSDVDAIVSLFNRPSFAASSHYVIDSEGHCAYIVREVDKSWTEATFNPVGISVEVIANGSEGRYLARAGLQKLAQVISDSAKRWDIPIRQGATSGCTVTRSGIVDHQSLGSCGGGHADITPYSVSTVIDAVQKVRRAGQVTSVDKVTCRKLNYWRTHGRHHGLAERRAIRRRDALAARGVTCTSSGPVRR